MGNMLYIKCDCGEEQRFFIGGGMLQMEPLVFEEIKKDEKYADIRQYVSSPDDIYNAENRLYHCKNCGLLEKHTYLRLKNNPKYILKHYCPDCNQRMAHDNIEELLESGFLRYQFSDMKKLETEVGESNSESIKIKCPKCKALIKPSADYSNINFGLWD